MHKPEITDRPYREVKDSELMAAAHLMLKTWPKDGLTEEGVFKDFKRHLFDPSGVYHLALSPEGRLLGCAKSYARRVNIGGRDCDIMALAGVAVEQECRGGGLGAALVRAAFARVDNGEFRLSIFQTAVPGFYLKLGCAVVENPVINSFNPGASPFWDPYIIAYPAARLPEKHHKIDLLGPGY